jgi:general secretion pathway protein A
MYESFFALTERPFTLRPDPSFLYLSRQHALALSMLEFGLSGQAGFVVVTGEVGAGKTTLIRHFLTRENRAATIGVISTTHAGFGDILQWTVEALNIETSPNRKSSRYPALTSYLAREWDAGRQVVLIVDEAQNLSVTELENLRLLSNIDIDRDHSLQIILVGQPELMDKLKRPELRQFAQRISVHYHLSPLTYRESSAYIRHRLAVAGATMEIFDGWAMAAVYYFAGGVPRIMNTLCDMAMVYAYAAGERLIDVETVLCVVRDRERNSILTLSKRSSDISREDLIDRAQRFFDEGEHASPAHQSANGHADLISIPSIPLNDAASQHPESELQAKLEIISAAAAAGQHPPDLEAQRPMPSIAALYLPDDDCHQHVALGQARPSTLRWLRRHLVTQRGR